MPEWVRLKLDLATFDANAFEPYLQRSLAAGIELMTIAELSDTLGNRRALYELNKTCSADIPERGEFFTFEEYVANRLNPSVYDPQTACA
ncbi:hypothetical protein [Actinopolymorpha alba]|uniref:hypothetical protein n=1 Tax=Actinopolymorpha alba TaxID=533267 RepID=UPI000380F5EA|nr:hypothetical protein [Actinopolymorpha alba]